MTITLQSVRAAVIIAACICLASCVVSETPLLVGTTPLLGNQFSMVLYRDFIPGRGYDAKQVKYVWADGGYVRDGATAPHIIKVVAEPMDGADVLIERSQADRVGGPSNVFTYWIGRKVANGAYIVFALNERDLPAPDRSALCSEDDAEGFCTVKNHEQLVLSARATAKMPPLNPAVAVIIDDSLRKERPF